MMKDNKLRELQLVELQILKDVAKMCDENNIIYFLDSGTLLGAVRHKGFIPWDDDVDIIMDVDNYIKFCELAPIKLSQCYFVQNMNTDPKVRISWSKVRKNGTTCMDGDLTRYDIHYGVGIDIFVLIGVPNSVVGRRLWQIAKSMEDILLDKYCYQARGAEVPRGWRLLWKMPDSMRMAIIRVLQKYTMRRCKGHKQCFNMWYKSPEQYAVSMEAYDEKNRIKLTFEDAEFWCPGGYEEVLKANYGEWRVIPSQEEQVNHGDTIVDLEKDYKSYYTGV